MIDILENYRLKPVLDIYPAIIANVMLKYILTEPVQKHHFK